MIKIQCFIFNNMTEVCGDIIADSCVLRVIAIENVTAE